jgi:hypothetical protein
VAKKEYWWVSVSGASCEPAVVICEEGERRAYTIGCQDYFKVDDLECLLKLISKIDDDSIPFTPKEEANWERRERRIQKQLRNHRYRSF